MDLNLYYTEIMSTMIPVIVLAGFIALTVSLIIMLINMLIYAFTGKGLRF